MSDTPSPCALPKVSIGLPVYNGAAKLPAVLDCILGQSFADFELVISDNGSTDSTREICEERARQDSRVRYVRHNENQGFARNFEFVYREARGSYFMWWAADDLRSENFLELTATFLDEHSDYIAATCRTRFEGGEFDPVNMGDGLLDAPAFADRLLDYTSVWHANGAFYSLYKRSALDSAVLPIQPYLAFDWSIVLKAAARGRFARLDSGWVEYGTKGLSSSSDNYTRSRTRTIHWFFPLWEHGRVVRQLAKEISSRDRARLLRLLLRLNYKGARIQFGHERRKWWLHRAVVRLVSRQSRL